MDVRMTLLPDADMPSRWELTVEPSGDVMLAGAWPIVWLDLQKVLDAFHKAGKGARHDWAARVMANWS